MTMSIPSKDELSIKRPVNDPRDFAKPVKEISMPQDVPSTSNRRLIELKNKVQRLMEAHLAPNQLIQVNMSHVMDFTILESIEANIDPSLSVGIKRLLDVLEVIVAKVRVTAAKQNLVLFSNLNENYAK
ncbi:hypothetical protein Tco_1425960 [Tanacetum coccineum]